MLYAVLPTLVYYGRRMGDLSTYNSKMVFKKKNLRNSKVLLYFSSFDVLRIEIDHVDRINTFVDFL